MRLWSVHPRYLDRQALVACWREGLLAQSVITKTSGGYSNHPQLIRFRACPMPLSSLGAFLSAIVDEADARGYNFARAKILEPGPSGPLTVTQGQLDYEWAHLLAKVDARSPEWRVSRIADAAATAHPLLTVVPGPIESWERLHG